MDATAAPVISFERVTKQYDGGTVAVEELSLDVAEGELLCLVGPSGCGKTTTMKMVNRLVEPTSGRVLVQGSDVAGVDPAELRRGIGYVIQQVGLFPHHSVGDNVATVPRLLGWDRARSRARVDELLDLVGLEPSTYRDRYPAQLSGGQRQRVGVARALAADPPVLLMDEPFSAIDPVARGRLQQEFLRVQRTVRKTIVFVTHDLDEAVLLADRVAVFAQGGVLVQHASPADVLGAPATPFVEEFVGSERGLRRLGVTALDLSALQDREHTGGRWGSGREVVTVDAATTLKDVLAAVLSSDEGWVLVRDGDSDLGAVGAQGVQEMLRASVARAQHSSRRSVPTAQRP